MASVRLEPLGALSVLQLDLALAPPIIDLLLGGEGKDGPLRELTDIEESILGSVVEIICRELTAAWQPVGLSFNFERRQMQTQVARVISVNEKTLCLSFEIRMPHSSGLLNLAFPGGRGQHHPAPADLGLGPPAPPAPEMPGSGWKPPRAASALAVRCSCLRCAWRPARFENLEPGSILRLDLAANTLPVWQVGGQTLAEAQAIRQGSHRAARIERTVRRRPRQAMKTYLDCWAQVAADLFQQALAGEPELVESLPRPFDGRLLRLCRHRRRG